MMRAIILAAGVGTRLKPVTNTIPKCLIDINGKALLEHSLDNLKQNNIDEVLIVIGHLRGLIKEKIGTSYNGVSVKYVENKEYSKNGNAYSLFKTKGLIEGDTLVIEGDLLYEPDAVKSLLECPEKNITLTTELSDSDDEIPVYTDKYGNLSFLKHPQRGAVDVKKDISDNDKIIGGLVGISKFSKDFLNEIYKEIEKAYTQGNNNQYYEEAVLLASKSIPIKCFLKKQLIWTEIDNEKDLNKARNVIFPKINKKFHV